MTPRPLALRYALFILLCHPSLRADAVTEWNSAALNAIRLSNTPPPAASRSLAILHASIYDAVNGIVRTHTHYLVTGQVPASASPEAAAAAAGHLVMTSLYPALRGDFDTLYHSLAGSVRDGPRKDQGIEWGERVAQAIMQGRATDGSDRLVTYTPGTEPGQWRPTVSFGGIVRPALLPQWGSVKPFAIAAVTGYRPPPPPPLHSHEYAEQVQMVRNLGGLISSARTAEQTQIAQFWGYGPGTPTPAGHWNQIAQVVAMQRINTLAENARLFALLNIAMADAAIVSWDCKYTYNFWRPITAIQEADTDGNPETDADPGAIVSVMRLAIALIFFLGHAVYAQAVTVGVIAAVPLTDTFDTGFVHEGTFDPKTVRYQVGPAIDMRLPGSFRVEFDALYQPFSFNESNFSGTPSQSHISGNLWQFPVLLKFRLPAPLVKPFVEAGPSVQIATNMTEISTNFIQPTPLLSHPDSTRAVGGIALGGGIDLRLSRFLISPQVRYTRWISKNFDLGPSVGSHLNAIQVLLSIRL